MWSSITSESYGLDQNREGEESANKVTLQRVQLETTKVRKVTGKNANLYLIFMNFLHPNA